MAIPHQLRIILHRSPLPIFHNLHRHSPPSLPSPPSAPSTPSPTATGQNVFSYQSATPQVDGATGALTQKIQLDIPPGRNGMQPDLSLIYNSRDTEQDSIVGYGWSLSIPYIERLNKTGSQDIVRLQFILYIFAGRRTRSCIGYRNHGTSLRHSQRPRRRRWRRWRRIHGVCWRRRAAEAVDISITSSFTINSSVQIASSLAEAVRGVRHNGELTVLTMSDSGFTSLTCSWRWIRRTRSDRYKADHNGGVGGGGAWNGDVGW